MQNPVAKKKKKEDRTYYNMKYVIIVKMPMYEIFYKLQSGEWL
jgi:hypothetical protein